MTEMLVALMLMMVMKTSVILQMTVSKTDDRSRFLHRKHGILDKEEAHAW